MLIPGEEELFQQLPSEMRAWFHFGKIVSFQFEEEYDEELYDYIYNGKIVLTDNAGVYKILLQLRGIYGEMFINIGSNVLGLNIENLITRGFENRCSYLISDFEQEEDIKIYCNDIYVSLME